MFRFRFNHFPLHQALVRHNPKVVIEAIKKANQENNFSQSDQQQQNLLQLAAKKGFVELVLWLLYAGVNVDLAQGSTETPL